MMSVTGSEELVDVSQPEAQKTKGKQGGNAKVHLD